MDRRIKLRHLEIFTAIARVGSLKRAADQVHLTQPAMSRTLRELEDTLGKRLMMRDRGGVTLTREGEVFLHFAEQSLAALRHGLSSLQGLGEDGAGRLAIGALPSVAAKLLPPALARFHGLAPRVSVQIEDGPHGYLVERLRTGALDLVIGRLGDPESMAGLSFAPLYSEHVVFVVAAGHALAGDSDLARIMGHEVLYPPRGAAIRPLVDRMMLAAGLGQRVVQVETVSGALGRALTLGPAGAVWIISHGVVADDIAAGRMVALPVDTGLTAGPVGIMARADETPDAGARLFRQALVGAGEAAGEAAGAGA